MTQPSGPARPALPAGIVGTLSAADPADPVPAAEGSGRRVGLLRDQRTLSVRDLQPRDLEAVRLVNLGLSPRSSHLRYFGTFECAGDGEVRRITATGEGRISLIGIVDARPVALAEIDGFDAPAGCELALAVDDDFQGLGVGTLLLAELIRRASGRGALTLRADILRDNRLMLELVQHSGLRYTMSADRDALHATFVLPQTVNGPV